jgi:hypothetical protein
MASYTDKIPTFNPYVAQQPVEAMLKVGMYKQQKYEEGVQRIQTSIDNVAGLDVASELDKKYLQSKLDGLGNNLNFVAGGDFSNFQLVNSVNGMTKQIVKDPNVINAVSSTANLRKQQKILEADEKAGKSSIQNRAKFEEGAGQYINKTHLKESYNGKYVHYTDMEKKLRDVAEKVHEVDNTVEDPFKRDTATGRHLMDKNGNPIVDDAILSITTKGKPAEKILANFYDSLDENDKQQLGIDAWYHYRGKTADNFKEDAVKNYEDSKQMLNDKIIQKNVELSTSPNLTTAERNKIQADINDASTTLSDGSLGKQLDAEFAQIDSNKDIEDYKYKLYTQKTLYNLAKDISYQSYKQEYKTNPYAQMDMQRRNLQFSYDNAARDQRNEDRKFKWGQYTWGVETAQKAEDAKALKDGSLPPVTNQALSTDVDTPSAGKLNAEILSIIGDRTEGGGIKTPGQIDLLTNEYIDKVTKSSLKTPQQKASYLDYLSREYFKNPEKVVNALGNPNLAQYLEKRRALEITAAQKYALYNGTKAASAKFDNQQKDVLKNQVGVNLNGRELYSSNELYNFSKDAETYWTGGKGGSIVLGGEKFGTNMVLDSDALLKAYKGKKEEPLVKAYIKRANGEALNPTERVLVDQAQNIKMKFDPQISKIHQAKQKFESDYLAAKMPERQSQVGTLDYDNNTTDQRHIKQLIGNKTDEFNKLGQVDVKKWGDFSPTSLSALRSKKNVLYTIEKRYDGSANLVVTDGAETQTIPMTSGELSKFFPNIAQGNPWSDVKNQVMSSASHTTNVLGVGDDSSLAVNAKFSGYQAPHLSSTALAPLVRFDVEGAADNDGGDNDSFILKMYVNNNSVWVPGYVGNRFTSIASVQEQMKQIGPGTVSDFLKIHK